jgi:hypothetical protein
MIEILKEYKNWFFPKGLYREIFPVFAQQTGKSHIGTAASWQELPPENDDQTSY